MVEQKFGRYIIHEELGRGGMGTVFIAFDTHREHNVALKVLPKTFLHDPSFRQRFANESKIIMQLEHDSIVPVYDYGEENGQPYLSMRLMRGGTLAEKIKDGALALTDIERILRRICSALNKAHRRNIIHRDLKPGNILFDEEGTSYLADFGIARLMETTHTMTMIGTPQYMAPEQALGKNLGPHTDVYQMASVLFEMLTGKPPYEAPTATSLLYKHANEPIPTLRSRNSSLPISAETVIQRAMAKDPAQRYASAGEFATAFTAVVAGKPLPAFHGNATLLDYTDEATYVLPATQAPAPRHQPASAEPEKKRKIPVWLLPLAGLFLMAFVVAFIVFRNKDDSPVIEGQPAAVATVAVVEELIPPTNTPEPTASAEPTATVAPTDTPLPAPTDTPAPTAIPDLMTSLGGGSGIITFASNVEKNFEIYERRLDGGTPQKLTSMPGQPERPVWSPDGSRMAVHILDGSNWEIYVTTAGGGNPVNVTNHFKDDSFPSWSPDGQQIIFHSNRGHDFEIFIMDADGRNVRQLTDNDVDDFGGHLSPDSAFLVFDRRQGSRHIFTKNMFTGEETRLTWEGANKFPVWSPDGTRIAFSSDRNGNFEIYVMNADGTNQINLTNTAHSDFYPQWSPDGQWLIFHENMDGNRELFAVRADGTHLTRLTNTPHNEQMPSWQPK